MSSSENAEIQFEGEEALDGMADHGQLASWIKEIVILESRELERIAYFFISDDALLELNKTYLNHDDLTDILTFPYSYKPIAADIYISYQRVAENARLHKCTTEDELLRVIIHGVLHMCGWKDTTDAEKKAMRNRENDCMSLWKAS